MKTLKTILVTGGTGYIGSHTVVELIEAGHEVVIVDNLCNSKQSVLDRLETITGQRPEFVQADVRDYDALCRIFNAYRIDAVMHFAGLKAVGESAQIPVDYYENNVSGSLSLVKAMMHAGVDTLVFSSSATVYGDPASVPIEESFPLSASNPYGRTKLMVEDILRDVSRANGQWRIGLLRYFNPVGAHSSGIIGEDPAGIPNNLVPYVSQVAVGRLEELSVYGNDYPTPDGTGVRDYLHVTDLAQGHIAALNFLADNDGLLTVNLGTGRGHSVLEMIRAFEAASGRKIPYRFVARRPGDVAQCFTDPSFAKRTLGWEAQLSIADMCADTWKWQCWAADNLVATEEIHTESAPENSGASV